LKNKQLRSDQFLQQVFNDQQIYDDKIWLLFIKLYSTLAETSAQSDRRGNLRGKSGLTLQNWCALSDQQAMCHHLRRNLFKPNQQGTASPNKPA
jgi:hypothetical protein